MRKIVELLLDVEGFDFEGLVDIISLVDQPAIGIDFLAFAEQQNFVTPETGETEEQYIPRCVETYINEGYPEEQALAICYYNWETKLSVMETEKHLQSEFLKLSEGFGEVINEDDIVYVDMSKAEFADIGSLVQGILALDILNKRGVSKDEPAQQRYQYRGPRDGNTRDFCQAFMRLNKVFTLKELRDMEGSLSGGGLAEAQNTPFSILAFKAGVNCRHRFNSVKIYKNAQNKTVVLDMGPVSKENVEASDWDKFTTEERNNAGTAMADTTNNGHTDQWVTDHRMAHETFAVVNEEQQIVIGPAMVPSKLILRKDEEGNPFYVFFSKETIRKIAQKFLATNSLHNTDINHDNNVVTTNTLLESWIVEDPELDKSKKYGFNLTEGSWMVSYKINDEQTWNKIKAGSLKGFSIAGTFLNKAL